MAPTALVSIGYEGRTLEDLVHKLRELRVASLADVRLTPLSRKPGLSKTRLGQALRGSGIDYVHFRALGNPRDNREVFRSGDAAAGCLRFAKILEAPDATEALERLEGLAREDRTAILCFERDHTRCHRQVIIDEVSQRLGAAAPVVYA